MDFSLRGIALAQGYPERYIQALCDRQRDIMQIMAMLPGKYRYEAVNAAVNASGVHPQDIYMSLCYGKKTIALALFYEALTGREVRL